MAETATVGELLVHIRADLTDLEGGLAKAQGLTGGFAKRSAPGIRSLENAFRGLAFSATGIPGPIGRVSTLLLRFSTGGVITIGVLAGIAAMGLAWRAFVGDLQKVGAEAEVLAKSLLRPVEALLQQTDVLERAIQLQRRQQGLLLGIAAVFAQLRLPGLELVVKAFESSGKAIERYEQALPRLLEAFSAAIKLQERLRIPGLNEPPAAGFRPEILPIGRYLGGERSILGAQLAELTTKGVERLQARINKIVGLAARRAQEAEELRQQWRNLGFTLGDYFLEGFRAATEGGLGSFLKGLGFTLLRGVIFGGISAATGGTFGAGFGAATGIVFPGSQNKIAAPSLGLDFSRFPRAQNPLAAARDRDWQHFFRESGLVARAGGFRG